MEFWKVLESDLKERVDGDPSTVKVYNGLISRIQNLPLWAPNPLLCPLNPLLFTEPCCLLGIQTGGVGLVGSPALLRGWQEEGEDAFCLHASGSIFSRRGGVLWGRYH